MEEYGFYAMLDRMQYINRWALMRNSRYENIKEHSFDVAVIAHALCLLHNKFNEGREGAIFPDPYKVMAYAIYHDCTEILTGDLPTPIKYDSQVITDAYKDIERRAADTLTDLLPADDGLKDEYKELLAPSMESEEAKLIHTLVKAADKISAYIKCMEEQRAGNHEFDYAAENVRRSIDAIDLPEVKDFLTEFLPAFSMTLDELNHPSK